MPECYCLYRNNSVMKKIIIFTLVAAAAFTAVHAQLKRGNPSTKHSSAALETESTSRGFLPSRMTQAQMTAISIPAAGLTVYCTDCSPVGYYTYEGTNWKAMGAVSGPCTEYTGNTLLCSVALPGMATQYLPEAGSIFYKLHTPVLSL